MGGSPAAKQSQKRVVPAGGAPGAAVAPKRARGERRVAAIIDAGAAVFAEKGYDGATMTEIAARADTAIGSLYRFFPTKATLADVLFKRYAERLFEGMAQLTEQAASALPLPSASLADALIDCMLALQSDRAAAIAMLDARDDTEALRANFRAELLRRIGALLRTAAGASDAYAAVSAIVLLQLLKCVPVLAGGETDSVKRDALGRGKDDANGRATGISRRSAFALAGTMEELRALTRLYTARIYAESADSGAAGATALAQGDKKGRSKAAGKPRAGGASADANGAAGDAEKA